MMKFPLSLRENGEANSYAILDGNGKWLLSLLHNGEPLVAEQRENLNYLIACANACRGLKADDLNRVGLVGEVGYQLIEKDAEIERLQARIAELEKLVAMGPFKRLQLLAAENEQLRSKAAEQAAPEPAAAVVEAGPNPYDDCLLIHESGSQRIGRIDHKGDCWRLARYQDCKSGSEVIWPLSEVVLAIPVIRFSGQSPAALLAELVAELDGLISESGGVYGLHMNGDLAPWPELLSGGRLCEWLESLDSASRFVKGGE